MEKNNFQVGQFFYADGSVTTDVNETKNLLGVIAWVNPDENAPEGKRGLILSTKCDKMPWSDKLFSSGVGIMGNETGEDNSRQLMALQAPYEVLFNAVAFAVEIGGFSPSLRQMQNIMKNQKEVNQALAKIKAVPLFDTVWTSSEKNYKYAYAVSVKEATYEEKTKEHQARCVISF